MKFVLLFFLLFLNSFNKFNQDNILKDSNKILSFMKITAKVRSKNLLTNFVGVYGSKIINNEDLAFKHYKILNGAKVHPTGEIKYMRIFNQTIKFHRLYNIDKNKLLILDNIYLKDNFSNIWIPSLNLVDINYPSEGTLLTYEGESIPNTRYDAACWAWALKGEFIANNENRYDYLYNESAVNPINIPLIDYQTLAFSGLRVGWENNVPFASIEARTELSTAASPLIGKIHENWNSENRRFRRALFRVVVENAGFIIVDDDRYQIHMRTENFTGYNHWGISVKMNNVEKSIEKRNYIQKIQPNKANTGDVKYNTSLIWYENLEEESLNVLSLKPNHFNVLQMAYLK